MINPQLIKIISDFHTLRQDCIEDRNLTEEETVARAQKLSSKLRAVLHNISIKKPVTDEEELNLNQADEVIEETEKEEKKKEEKGKDVTPQNEKEQETDSESNA